MVLVRRRLLQVLNLPKDCCTIEREVLFRYADESHHSSRSSHAEGFGQECLYQGGVAFVRGGKDLGGQGADGENVGLVEGAGVKKAFRMFEGDEDGGDGSLVSLGQMLREVL